jgi:hypothetical protein
MHLGLILAYYVLTLLNKKIAPLIAPLNFFGYFYRDFNNDKKHDRDI